MKAAINCWNSYIVEKLNSITSKLTWLIDSLICWMDWANGGPYSFVTSNVHAGLTLWFLRILRNPQLEPICFLLFFVTQLWPPPFVTLKRSTFVTAVSLQGRWWQHHALRPQRARDRTAHPVRAWWSVGEVPWPRSQSCFLWWKKTPFGLDGRNNTLKVWRAVPLTLCGQLCYLPQGCSVQTVAPGCWREQIQSGRSCSDTSTSALMTRLPKADTGLAYRKKTPKSVGALLATYLQGFPLQHWQLTAVSRHKVIAAAIQPFTLWWQTVSISKTQKSYMT